MATRPAATIEIGGVLARVVPASVESVIAQHLSYRLTTVEPAERGGYRKQARTKLLYKPDGDGGLLVPAGLGRLVAGELGRAGYHVAIEDRRRFDERAGPDGQLVRELHGPARALAEAVVQEPRGHIRLGTKQDIVAATAGLCRLFPRGRILIALPTRKEVGSFLGQLRRLLGTRFDTADSYPFPWQSGRLVGSLHVVDCCNKYDWDLVVLPDARAALGRRHQEVLWRLPWQRVYGFLLPGQRALSRRQQLQLQAAVGPVIFEAPDPRGDPAGVRVVWLPPPWAAPRDGLPALARKRALWHDGRRNELIADVASAVKSGDQVRIWECGLLFDAADRVAGTPTAVSAASWAASSCSSRAVTILAESAEHGRELLRRLPGWQLLDLVPSAAREPNAHPGSRLEVRPLDRKVVTFARAAKLVALDTDVLLRVDGQGWPLELAGFPPRREQADRDVLLIDLADDFDRQAKDAALARRRDYDARGWAVGRMPTWLAGPS